MAEAILARTGVSLPAMEEAITQATDALEQDIDGQLEDINQALALKADKAKQVSFILTAAGWTGTERPYTQTVSVTGLGASQAGFVGLAQSATAAQREAAAGARLSVTGQAAGTITIAADGVKPSVDIPCTMTILG